MSLWGSDVFTIRPPCLLPNFAYPYVFINFLLGISAVPRETEHNAYAKFWGQHTRCIMGDVQMENLLHFLSTSRGWIEKLAFGFSDECNITFDSSKKISVMLKIQVLYQHWTWCARYIVFCTIMLKICWHNPWLLSLRFFCYSSNLRLAYSVKVCQPLLLLRKVKLASYNQRDVIHARHVHISVLMKIFIFIFIFRRSAWIWEPCVQCFRVHSWTYWNPQI